MLAWVQSWEDPIMEVPMEAGECSTLVIDRSGKGTLESLLPEEVFVLLQKRNSLLL